MSEEIGAMVTMEQNDAAFAGAGAVEGPTMVDRVILAVIAGLAEHSGLNLSAETVVNYAVNVALHVSTAMDLDQAPEDEQSAYYREAFLAALGGVVANHGTKWSAAQAFEGAHTMASLAIASREAAFDAMARHREEEAKRKTQAAVTDRVKSMAGMRRGAAQQPPPPPPKGAAKGAPKRR
jgi:hypothetical protein